MTEALIGPIGLLWLAALLVGMPILAMRQPDDISSYPRPVLYASTITALWFLAACTTLVAWWEGYTAEQLYLVALPPVKLLVWSLVILAAGLVALLGNLGIQQLFGHKEPEIVDYLMPRTTGEKNGFVLVSLSAGICEEWMFRGFVLATVLALTGSEFAAMVLQAASFGAAHSYQSRWGMSRATTLGIILAVPCFLCGSFWPSALAHLMIDVLAGLVIWPLFRGRVRETDEPAGMEP